jgi:DNA-binding Xre family transcriptional regulator
MAVGFRLREVMEGHDPKPSVRRLAIDAGLDIKTVRAIRDNATTRVDLETLGALADVLGCEPGELIGRQGRRGGGRGR